MIDSKDLEKTLGAAADKMRNNMDEPSSNMLYLGGYSGNIEDIISTLLVRNSEGIQIVEKDFKKRTS